MGNVGIFEGRILVEPMENFWCLREPFAYITSKGMRIDVTEGFLFDGFSIPRLFWSICSPLDKRVFAGGCVHDFCFATHCVSAIEAHEILVEAISVSEWERNAIFDAVRLFGATLYETGPARQAALRKRLLFSGLS
jgi:hypothetical protein